MEFVNLNTLNDLLKRSSDEYSYADELKPKQIAKMIQSITERIDRSLYSYYEKTYLSNAPIGSGDIPMVEIPLNIIADVLFSDLASLESLAASLSGVSVGDSIQREMKENVSDEEDTIKEI